MTILLAPESILEMLSCGCVNNQCGYRANGIPCTDMCKLKNCSDSVAIEESDDEYDDDDDDDDDHDDDDDNEQEMTVKFGII